MSSVPPPSELSSNDAREILIPHDPASGPVTAVKHLVLQSSLKHLEERGHFERYKALVDPAALERLQSGVASEWTPIAVADAHYAACDNMLLDDEEIANVAQATGDRLQRILLVSATKKAGAAERDVWSLGGQLHRLWGRQYQGGSLQIVKVGEKGKLLELRGLQLNRYRYFRYAQLTVITANYDALGLRSTSARIANYNPSTGELAILITWA
jgi:hypothetical protein